MIKTPFDPPPDGDKDKEVRAEERKKEEKRKERESERSERLLPFVVCLFLFSLLARRVLSLFHHVPSLSSPARAERGI